MSPVRGPRLASAQAVASTIHGQTGFLIITDRNVSRNTNVENLPVNGQDGTGPPREPTNQTAALNLAKTDQVLCGETENVDVGLRRSVVALNILDPARCLFALDGKNGAHGLSGL